MKKIFLTFLLSIFIGFLSTSFLYATTISYGVQDLKDSNPAYDLWQYSYTLSDNDFNLYEGFTIWFDYGLYDNIQPQSNPTLWDVVSWDPGLIFGVPDSGAYDALALSEYALLTDSFTVSFNWLGGPEGPKSQRFEIYDSSYVVNESGVTSKNSPVPEPSSIVLLGIGLFAIVSAFRKNKFNEI